jgi:hypothetical protein
MPSTGKTGQPAFPRLPRNRTCCGHAKIDANDPMYGPAVRRKRFFVELAVSGLASMYPASDWSVLRFGPSWVSARVRSH